MILHKLVLSVNPRNMVCKHEVILNKVAIVILELHLIFCIRVCSPGVICIPP